MPTCRECGHVGGATAKFCTRCGAAVHQPAAVAAAPSGTGQSRRALTGVAAAGVAALAAVTAVAVLSETSGTSGDSRAAADRPAARAPLEPTPGRDTATPTTPTTPATTATPAPSTAPTDPATARAELDRQLAADRSAVDALLDQWVPQLSAKRPGLVVNGTTYGYVEILADFRTIQASYPDARLLFSGEYSSFRYGDFWITVVPRPFATGESANSWCDTEGVPVDDCYAKMISRTRDYAGATLHRGG